METQNKIITTILHNNTTKMKQISPSQMSSKGIQQSKGNQNNIILPKADKIANGLDFRTHSQAHNSEVT